jgi:hypothetical protein
MIVKLLKFVALVIIFNASLSQAQTITSAKLQRDRVDIGSLATIVIDFRSDGVSSCGLSVDWGDGDKPQRIRVSDEEKNFFTTQVTKSFTSTGTFSISLKSEFLSRGLKSVVGCEVPPDRARLSVTVTDPVAEAKLREIEAEQARVTAKAREDIERSERERRELEQRQRDIAKREVELEKRKLELEEFEKKQIELAQREREIKQRELAIKGKEGTPAPESKPNAIPLISEAEKRQKIAEDRAAAQRERQLKEQAERQAKEEERKKAAEERERVAVLKRREIEEERTRQIQAREEADRRRREEADAEKRRIIEARTLADRSKRQAVETALLRPLISNQDPRISCQSAWDLDPQYLSLIGKISLTSMTDISFQMLADSTFPNAKERQAIANLAESYNRCASDSSSYRRSNYSAEVFNLLSHEDKRILDLKLELYNRKLTYGNYNSAIQQIVRDSRTRLELMAENHKREEARKVAEQEAEQARQKAEHARQQDMARSRAAALEDAKRRQDEQQRAEAAAQERARQVELNRRAELRQRWDARCKFDAKNAYDRYVKSKENDCAGPNRGLAALCAIGILAGADEYQKSAYASCMSGAP